METAAIALLIVFGILPILTALVGITFDHEPLNRDFLTAMRALNYWGACVGMPIYGEVLICYVLVRDARDRAQAQ